jgi:hypothetical protein
MVRSPASRVSNHEGPDAAAAPVSAASTTATASQPGYTKQERSASVLAVRLKRSDQSSFRRNN